MDTWAKATPEDREAIFNQTAVTQGVSPEIVEKDFWVCWTLHQIFQFQDFPRLIFKGGTSVSKAFGMIKRFSEDIDLVINRHELGFKDENDPANQQGTKLRDRTIEKLKSSCRTVIRNTSFARPVRTMGSPRRELSDLHRAENSRTLSGETTIKCEKCILARSPTSTQ